MMSSQNIQLAVIITVPLVTLLVTLLLATYCVYHWNCCKRRVGGADAMSINMFNDEACPEAIITYGETLLSLIRSSEARGITTGLPLLIQQSLISRTEILKQIGCGTFYKLHLGRWREEQLLVKLYTSHEPLWKNETFIYQVPLLRHDNLVTFLAAGTAGGVVGCILLQYCQPETLSEHLQENSLTVQQMLGYITDVCRGLVHLHSELTKGSYTKPIIAHCQLTSDNVLVSCEGKCLIWNLELAIASSVSSVHLTLPYCQYYCLSPQVLVQVDNKLDIMCYVESDVYALGLLMWQLSKRCSLNGTFEEYEVPYMAKLCSPHPTRHDLITLVCHQHYRPEVSHRLYSHSLEPIKSNSHLSRMRNMLAHSPLGRRRHSSSGSITSSNESPLTSPVGRVWGISLELLVKQTTKEVPFIVEKIIEHIEQYGLDQEGLYRVNGNARTIEKLKASFDKVGDADFCDVDVAAIGGLLKLFLRDMPVSLITESVASQFVQLHEDVKSYTGQQYYEKIRSLVKQLPLHHYHLLRYLVRHLVCVAKHEEENKMSPVSLSIVFGPNIFRCDAGLAGLQKQGVCNSFLSKMIMKCDQVFMQDDEVWIAQVKEEAQQRRQKPQKPVPYSVYMENLNSLEELDDDDRSHYVLSSSWGHSPTHITKSSTTSPAHITKTNTSSKSSTNERNVDDWVTASYPGGSQSPLNRSHDSDPDLGNGRFVREVGIRRRSSIDGVRRKTSLSPPREEELPRTPSPWSQCSNSPISPNSSPVQGTSQVMSQFLSTVIQQTVRELLFGPSGSHGTSTPAKPVSLARQRRRNTPGTRGGGSTANDVTNTNTATDDKNTKEGVSTGDMTSSVTSHGGDTTDSSKTHPVILRRGSSKEEKEKKKINRESGALFSEQFKVATGHSSVDEIDGVEQSEVTNKLKHHKKHKPVVKGFDLFESSGLIMGAPIMAKPTVVMPNSQEHHHFVMTSSESHDEEDTLSQSTGLYDVKMVKSSLQPLPVASDDLDVVKSIETLSHPTLGRPRPPANRRSPGRRGHGVDTNSVPDKKHTLLSSSDELNNIPATQLGHNVLSVTLHSKTDATLQTISSDNVQSNNLQTKSSDNLQSKSSDSLHTQSSNTLQAKSSDETKSSDNFQAKSSDKLPTKSSKNIQPKSSNNLQAKAKSSDKRTKPSDTFKSVGELHTKTSSVIYSKTIGSDHLSLTATAAAGSPTHRRLHDVASPTHTGLHDVDSRTHNNGPHNTGSSTHNRSHDVASSTHTRLHDVGSPTHNRPHDASSSIRSRSHDVGSPTHRKSHDASPTHSTSLDDQQRRLKELKNEVRRFEADYMAQHGGNKPSGADKDPIRPLMREYFTIKHQLQSSSEMLSKTAPAKLITKREPDIHRDEHTDRHTDGLTVGHMDLCTALEKCQKLLADNRRKAGRPDSLDHMSLEQLREEKLSVQKTLIEFENEHGRPETEEGKEMMRPIYDYYRQLKKLLGGRRGSTRSKSQGAELALTTVSMLTAQDASDVSQLPPNVSCGTTVSPPHTRESVSSVESYEQVKEKLDNALAEKHNLKQLIRKCEEDFLQEHGRAVMEKEDRQPLQQHYTAYKRIKAHIKLLQTILTKKDSNITV